MFQAQDVLRIRIAITNYTNGNYKKIQERTSMCYLSISSIFITLLPIIIMWLIPKSFMVSQMVGAFFRDVVKHSYPFSIQKICNLVSDFEKEADTNYYRYLRRFSAGYIALVLILNITFEIFLRGKL